MPPAQRSGPAFRLVALDVDGTILNSAQQVTAELKAALARLAGLSVRTVICTGRRWHSALPVLQELDHVHPVVVCTGGALIKSADGGRTLRSVPMAHETARLAVDLFRGCGLVPMLLYDRSPGECELKLSDSDRGRALELPYVRANPGCWEWYPGRYPPTQERPLAAYSLDHADLVARAEDPIRRGLGDRAIVEVMAQPRYGEGQLAIEVHDPGATKWRALKWLLDRWSIRPAEVVAIGDDVNDVPMLRAAGLSFAMGNAPDHVKEAADAVTSSNDAHGVVEALTAVFGRQASGA